MIVWLCLLFIGGIARADSVDLGTTVGAGSFIQSISASRHVFEPDPEDSNPFLKKKAAQEEDVHPRIPRPYPVSWNIGYTYSQTATDETETTDATVDRTHIFMGGLDWEALDTLEFTGGVTVTSTPAENYRAGMLELHVGYLDFLDERRKRRRPKDDDDDFARDERTGSEADFLDEMEPDPDGASLLFRLNLLAMNHEKKPLPTPRRFRLAAAAAGGERSVYEGGLGIDVTWSPNPDWALRAGATKYHYSSSIDDLLASYDQGTERQRLGAALTGLAGFASYLQSFPDFMAEASVTRNFSDAWQGEAHASLTVFEQTGAGSALTFGAGLAYSFSRRWTVNAGGDFSTGDGTTALLGTAGLSYRLDVY